MNVSTLVARVRRWVRADATGRRRAIASMPVVMIGLALWIALAEWTHLGGVTLLVPVLVVIGVGWFARTWLALATTYVATVAFYWVIELSIFAWLGASEWEAQNIEHWQGDEPAVSKLVGQLIEYAVFGIFLIPFVALGIWIGRQSRLVADGSTDRQAPAT
jgi:hypothetical protein